MVRMVRAYMKTHPISLYTARQQKETGRKQQYKRNIYLENKFMTSTLSEAILIAVEWKQLILCWFFGISFFFCIRGHQHGTQDTPRQCPLRLQVK